MEIKQKKGIDNIVWFKIIFLHLVIVYVLSQTSVVFAWTPKTHVYLAEQALNDALDNGRVKISLVDFWNKQIINDLPEEYEVDPIILQAISSHRDQFRAGVIGPDGYPDIVTGQTVIHPPDGEKGHTNKYIFADGTNNWLELLWNASKNQTDPRVTAFVVGFLAHAAGDMYGHTLVNALAGGPFEIGDNAFKHILVEKFIDKYSPQISSYNFSIQGVEPFIYEYLIEHQSLYEKKYDIVSNIVK